MAFIAKKLRKTTGRMPDKAGKPSLCKFVNYRIKTVFQISIFNCTESLFKPYIF